MYVTSDIFDLEQIARNRGIPEWRERLVGGIAIHGTEYPGGQAVARFLTEAAGICGLQLPTAGYAVRWDDLHEQVDQDAIAELARGARPAASGAESVYMYGYGGSSATHDKVEHGGWLDAAPRRLMSAGNAVKVGYPHRAFDGDFRFPLDGPGSERAEALLRSAAQILGAEYGYHFIRDALAQPHAYARAIPTSVDRSLLARVDSEESDRWRKFIGEGDLWTGPWPQLRDLFAVNLLSARHFSSFIEPVGYLDEWITAEPGRGRLTEAADGRVLWTLTDSEIHAIRPVLWDTSLLRTCMPRVYRDLPYARERPDLTRYERGARPA
jgi:hypothetical protein